MMDVLSTISVKRGEDHLIDRLLASAANEKLDMGI